MTRVPYLLVGYNYMFRMDKVSHFTSTSIHISSEIAPPDQGRQFGEKVKQKVIPLMESFIYGGGWASSKRTILQSLNFLLLLSVSNKRSILVRKNYLMTKFNVHVLYQRHNIHKCISTIIRNEKSSFVLDLVTSH